MSDSLNVMYILLICVNLEPQKHAYSTKIITRVSEKRICIHIGMRFQLNYY